MSTPLPSLQGKRALVTGANRGLGFEIAAGLAGAGAQVTLACRDPAKAEAAAQQLRARVPGAQLETMQLDVASLASVRRFAGDFGQRHPHLDILCNNAAAILVPRQKTADGFEMHIGTNHVGPFALTGLLLPLLVAAPQARVVNTSSLAHRLTPGVDLDDLHYDKRPYKEMAAYGASKLAALLFTFELEKRLRKARAPAIALAAHPGYTATNLDLGNFFMRLSTRLFAQPPAMGALPALHAAAGSDVRGGDFYGPGGFKELKGAPVRVEPRPEARDAALASRLWSVSQELSGVRFLDS